jgi:transcription antitermination factor NusG
MRSLAVHPGMAAFITGLPNGWCSHLASPTTETNEKRFFLCFIISLYTFNTIISRSFCYTLQYSCFICFRARTIHGSTGCTYTVNRSENSVRLTTRRKWPGYLCVPLWMNKTSVCLIRKIPHANHNIRGGHAERLLSFRKTRGKGRWERQKLGLSDLW